jgi:uncharacterized protein (DUF1499 family)
MGYRLPAVPESRFALVAQRLVYAAIAVILVAVLAVRSGKVEPLHGLAVLTGGVVLAAASVAVGLVAGLEIWRRGHLGLGRLVFSMLLAAGVLAYPAMLAGQALRLPVLNDISTDLDDPPVFSSTRTALALRGGRIPPDIDRRRRVAQERAYPLIRTIVLENEPEEAFQLVVKAVKTLKWRIIEEIRPDDRRGQGRIDATEESRLMRFTDDITIRFRWTGTETRVDIRSVSRLGRHDFGANAARIQRLAQEIASPRD